MTKEDVYYIGTHPTEFRRNTPAKVIGFKMVTPEGLKPRLCYEVEYSDGQIDYKVVDDNIGNKLVTLKEIKR